MLGGLSLFFLSCNNWLDVNPKSQIKNDILFQDEKGFKTALFGVYTGMASSNLYGQNLSMSFLDALAQYYPMSSNTNTMFDVVNYDYESSSVKPRIEMIWEEAYKMIMNCNNLLENMDKRPEVFTGHNEQLIRGEALGLRAYLHFDLLRMYAPSFAVGEVEPAIPYVDRVTHVPFPQLTNEQVVVRILEDCEAALADLKEADPLGPAGEELLGENETLDDRKERMNYYAVMALMARVYLWSGNTFEAGRISGDLIQVEGFGVTGPFFQIYSDKISTNADELFGAEAQGYLKLILSGDYFKTYFEAEKYSSLDQRITYGLQPTGSADGSRLIIKYAKSGNSSKHVTLLGMNEMYYIHAECCGNEETALQDLNKVRQDYGIPAEMDLVKGMCNFEDELYKEYRKSFLAEGQLFFFMKRKDFSTIPNAVIVADPRTVYCLPLPQEELDFGNLIK